MKKSYVVLFCIIMITFLGASSWQQVSPQNRRNMSWPQGNSRGFGNQGNTNGYAMPQSYSSGGSKNVGGGQNFVQETQSPTESFSSPQDKGGDMCENQYEKNPEYRQLVESIKQLTGQEKELRNELKMLLTKRGNRCSKQEYTEIIGRVVETRLKTGIRELQQEIKKLNEESSSIRPTSGNGFAVGGLKGSNSFSTPAQSSSFGVVH